MCQRVFYKLVLILVLSGFVSQYTHAQSSISDSTISTFILQINYAYQIPGGDMAEDYGHNSTIGPEFTYKTNKNWLWGLEANFIFGNDVKKAGEIIAGISDDSGFVIGMDGTYTNIRPMERGFSTLAKVGKVIPAFNINPNSGIVFNFGIGYMQHKIRWDVESNNAPQLSGDYVKGYDRFTEGFIMSQSLGLFYLGDARLWNFKAAVEVQEAFTTLKRYNFDTMGGDSKNRVDLFFGLKLSWMIPLYGRAPKAIYYF